MINLTIETSTKNGVVLLSRQDQLIACKTIDASLNLARELLPSIQTILEENQLSPKQLCIISCGYGPGSYTGTRMAAAVAKSLAFALNLPLIGFCSALAFLPASASGKFLFISDAKMGQISLLNGWMNSNSAQFEKESLKLIHPNDLSHHFKEIDFIVSSISFSAPMPVFFPEFNPYLVANIIYKKFNDHDFAINEEMPLIYYR